MNELFYFCARTTAASLAALILLLAYAHKARAADGPTAHTSLLRESVAGQAASGESLRVTGSLTLPTGEKFAQVEKAGRSLWLQLPENDPLPSAGETITLSGPALLLTQPVAEVEEPGAPEPEALDSDQGAPSKYPLNPGKMGMSQECTAFIRPDGKFGSWGAFLMDELNPRKHGQLFRENVGDMPRICPRFGRMSDTEKRNFWVWLIAAMANGESGCKERITARGVNGTAAGLLQLHLNHESAYGCEPGTNSLRARDNLKCGLVILNNDVDRTDRVFPSSNNYWQVLRINSASGQRTYRLAQKYAPCH